MGKLVIIPVLPDPARRKRERVSDRRYVEGQRLLVKAMKYLVKSGPRRNRPAIDLISEHVRTRFRMSDSPLANGHS